MRTFCPGNIFIVFLSVCLFSCSSGKLYLKPVDSELSVPNNQIPAYTIYAIGDAGELNEQSRAVLAQLARVSGDDVQSGVVIIVGDNIYPAGMPPGSNIEAYQDAQDVLNNQVFSLSSYPGKKIFIPGNHDWNEFHPGGLDAIKRQGEYLKALNDPLIGMLPENGCGGPEILELNDQIVLIIIDSQWWLQDWENEPKMNEDCNIQIRDDLISALHNAIEVHKDKQIVIAMHHPMYTQGTHGGHFTVRDHLFPLSKVVKWLYLPLPVIGSIYPYYRSVIGHPQDIQHRHYSFLRDAILREVENKKDVIFLAGHDHNLQYIRKKDDHFILSGSGSKLNAVANSPDLIYGHKAPGFMQLDFFKNGSVRLAAYEVEPKTGTSDIVFSRFIVGSSAP